MKDYLISTTVVQLPPATGQSPPVVVSLPDNVTPIGVEVRPSFMPDAVLIHYLTLINGEVEEAIPPAIYKQAWDELYNIYGERSEQSNLALMDSVLQGVSLEKKSEEETRKEEQGG